MLGVLLGYTGGFPSLGKVSTARLELMTLTPNVISHLS